MQVKYMLTDKHGFITVDGIKSIREDDTYIILITEDKHVKKLNKRKIIIVKIV